MNTKLDINSYKLGTFDLDGTILANDFLVKKTTRKAILRLKEFGIITVVSSSRGWCQIPNKVRPLFDYFCLSNGSLILDKKLNTISCEEMEKESVISVVKIVESFNGAVLLHKKHNILVSFNAIKLGKKYANKIKLSHLFKCFIALLQSSVRGCIAKKHVSKYLLKDKTNTYKILILLNDKKDTNSCVEQLSKIPNLEVVKMKDGSIEVTKKGINKEFAVSKLLNTLNVNSKNVISFADALMDKKVLEMSGFSVVPLNGDQEAKNVANYICESNNDDGVGKAIVNLFNFEDLK